MLLSFPTRRSSDLAGILCMSRSTVPPPLPPYLPPLPPPLSPTFERDPVTPPPLPADWPAVVPPPLPRDIRSEEHTSELQSHVKLVCRLLLEKKKVSASCRPNAPDHAKTISCRITHGARSLFTSFATASRLASATPAIVTVAMEPWLPWAPTLTLQSMPSAVSVVCTPVTTPGTATLSLRDALPI